MEIRWGHRRSKGDLYEHLAEWLSPERKAGRAAFANLARCLCPQGVKARHVGNDERALRWWTVKIAMHELDRVKVQ
jgi:hypothetical protein